MKLIALVPMKGHSERIQDKNIRNFNGKPLFVYIINTLLSCSEILKIVVNTDSNFIKNKIKKNYGDDVVIHNRPIEICSDFVSMNKIIKYDIDRLETEHFLQTHSTNPLLKKETIKKAINKYYENLNNYDSLFTVTQYRTRFYWVNGEAINHKLGELIRTQDLSPIYEENSNLYIFSKTSFKQAGNNRIGLKPYMYEIKKLEDIDIDNEEDFILAENLYKYIHK